MSKIYIYRCKDDTATIYYSKEFPESKGILTFEYEGDIPEGPGVLKTDGIRLYREETKQNVTAEPSLEDRVMALESLLNIEVTTEQTLEERIAALEETVNKEVIDDGN